METSCQTLQVERQAVPFARSSRARERSSISSATARACRRHVVRLLRVLQGTELGLHARVKALLAAIEAVSTAGAASTAPRRHKGHEFVVLDSPDARCTVYLARTHNERGTFAGLAHIKRWRTERPLFGAELGLAGFRLGSGSVGH